MNKEIINQPRAIVHSFLLGLSGTPLSIGASLFINKMEKIFNVYDNPEFRNLNPIFPDEVFKEVKGYEGHYSVSNYGRVKSLNRQRKQVHNLLATVNEIILKIKVCRGGYAVVGLSLNGKTKTKLVHQLVANAFLEFSEKPMINHKNGHKIDNRWLNLERCTHAENSSHASKLGLMTNGVNVYCAKLNYERVGEIKKLYLMDISIQRLSIIFDVSRSTIKKVLKARSWASKHAEINYKL
jgi:hypothetical protein